MDLLALTTDLEPLTHRERVRRVLALGRRARAGEEDARAALAALGSAPDTYPRALAVHALFVTHDRDALFAALADDSQRVRQVALRAAAVVLTDDADAARALTLAVPAAARARLVRMLWQRGRTRAIELFLEGARTDPRALDLLAFTSTGFAQAWLAEVGDRLGPDGWCRLAKHQPALLRDALLRALASGTPDRRLGWRLGLVLDCLAEADPDAALALLDRLFVVGDGGFARHLSRVAPALLRTRPAAVFDRVRRLHERGPEARPPSAFAGLRLDAAAPRLGAERLAYAVREAWVTLSDGRRGERWLARLDPLVRTAVVDAWLHHGRGAWGAFLLRHAAHAPQALREAAFERWAHAARSSEAIISPSLLAALPRDLREREARRHLDRVAALSARPRERTAYAVFLPLEETLAALKPYLGHPEGEERGAALALLVTSVRSDRARLPAVLSTLVQRRFEQDPVRLAMTSALLALPAGCFRTTDLAAVGELVQAGLDAADLSSSTGGVLEALVVRLFRLDPAWGATWLGRVIARRGTLTAGGLGTQLARREVPALVPTLEALAHAWSARERHGSLLWLARSLGPRLDQVPGLLDALERVVRASPHLSEASAALGLLREAAPARVATLVPALLAHDASAVALAGVPDFLSMHRQDLLDPFLGPARPIAGRFASGLTHWVISFRRGTQRWTAGQQRRHADALTRITDDPARDVPAIRGAIEALADLAFVEPTALLRLARDPRPPVRELAVRALPRLDGTAGVPELIEALGDDRARWSIYALRTVLARMPRADVLARLAQVPTRKVTVAKEVVRLLGELGGPDAFAVLERMLAQPLHRDVRIALLRALWDHLEAPATWVAFERAVADPDWVVAIKIADLPVGRLTPAQEASAVELLARLLERPEPEARLALLGRAASIPLADHERRWFHALLTHYRLATGDEAVASAVAVKALLRAPEVDAVVDAIDGLRARPRDLRATLGVWAAQRHDTVPQREIALRVAGRLASAPLLVPDRVRFAASVLDSAGLAELLIALASADQLHYDVMRAADAAVSAAAAPEIVERSLASSRDARLRRLAVSALVEAAAPENGWTPERRARLALYRADPDAGVAGAAARVEIAEV